jgi:hypothetical protein
VLTSPDNRARILLSIRRVAFRLLTYNDAFLSGEAGECLLCACLHINATDGCRSMLTWLAHTSIRRVKLLRSCSPVVSGTGSIPRRLDIMLIFACVIRCGCTTHVGLCVAMKIAAGSVASAHQQHGLIDN